MMRSRFVAALLGTLGLVLVRALDAQTAVPAAYDTTKSITLNGTLRVWNLASPHVYLVVDTKDANGKTEQWTVQGGSTVDLLKAGWDVGPRGTMKAADPITVVVYLPKADAMPEPIPDDLRIYDILKDGRRAWGTEVTFKDGKKYAFGASR